jgi:HEAT repeat protein
VDEYARAMDSGVQKAAEAGKELGEDATLELEETVDCLACIGNAAAVDYMGGFALTTGRPVPDTTSLQLQCVQALKGIKTPAAILWLGEVAGAPGTSTPAIQVGMSALMALEGIGEPAVDVLVGALGDKDWADGVLVDMGAPAVPRLAQALASSEATVRYRAWGTVTYFRRG